MRPPSRSLLSLPVAVLAGVTATPAAWADASQPASPPAASVYATCDKQPTHDDSEAAHAAFLLGKRKYDEADYPAALVYFKDAYKTDCTKHELLPIIAAAFVQNGDKVGAVRALEVYLKRVPNPPDLDVQQKKIANLRAQIADQHAAPAVPVAPPPEPAATAAPTPAPAREHTLAPWIVVGAGGALVVGGGITLVLGLVKVLDVYDKCPNTLCKPNTLTPAQANAQDQSGKNLETAGGVILGVGALAVAGGLAWHFLEKPANNENKQPAEKTSVRIVPSVAPGYAGVGVGGRF